MSSSSGRKNLGRKVRSCGGVKQGGNCEVEGGGGVKRFRLAGTVGIRIVDIKRCYFGLEEKSIKRDPGLKEFTLLESGHIVKVVPHRCSGTGGGTWGRRNSLEEIKKEKKRCVFVLEKEGQRGDPPKNRERGPTRTGMGGV